EGRFINVAVRDTAKHDRLPEVESSAGQVAAHELFHGLSVSRRTRLDGDIAGTTVYPHPHRFEKRRQRGERLFNFNQVCTGCLGDRGDRREGTGLPEEASDETDQVEAVDLRADLSGGLE